MHLWLAVLLLCSISGSQLTPIPDEITQGQLAPALDSIPLPRTPDRILLPPPPHRIPVEPIPDGLQVNEAPVEIQPLTIPDGLNNVCEPPTKRRKLASGSRCLLQFSEFKFGWSPDTLESPFIELFSKCEKRRGPIPPNALKNYVMAILKAQPLSLAMVVSFEYFPYDGVKPFIVIGSPDTPNVDISTATPHLQSAFSQVKTSEMFPHGDSNLYAVVLLRDLNKAQSKSLNLPRNAAGQTIFKILTANQLKTISTKTVDMLIIGDTFSQKSQEFEDLWSAKSSKIPMFAEKIFQMKTSDIGMSLSNCQSDYQGFNSEAFEIQPQSPGEVNSCNAVADQEEEFATSIEDETIEPSGLLHSIPYPTLQNVRNSQFNPDQIIKCQDKFPKRTRLLENDEVQKWIQFGNGVNECRFTCKACELYRFVGFRPDVKMKPKIVTTGYLSNDIYDNGIAITSHANYPMHNEATEFYERIAKSTSDKEVYTIIRDFENREVETFNATMNVLLVSYAEIKAGVSFRGHETIMKALRNTGANVGTKHHTGEAAQSIAKIIAKTFRFKMLKHLVNTNQHFSIMVDSSTSFNLPFLAIYLQVLEEQYPVTHFYSLIYMAEGEKARDMTDYFILQVQKDDTLFPGFENYFISKLVAFSSDGASVMVGSKSSFKVFLSKYVGREVPNVVCLAHKLDSSYKLGIKPSPSSLAKLDNNNPDDRIKLWHLNYFQSFEKTSNELYSFYASRGYKKWHHLLATAEELGIVPKRMKYVHEIRWSESHYQALQTVHHNYFAIVEDLDQLTTDKESDANSRSSAEQHYNRMTDKTYVIVLHEFLDILTTFKRASQQFQESSSTVVGKIEILYSIIKAIQEYKTSLGSWMKDLLKNCACGSICSDGDCSMEMYLDCTEVTINGVKLLNHHAVILPYAELRNELYENMVLALKRYFDFEMMEAFQIFNPHRINFAMEPENLNFLTIEDFYTIDETVEELQVHENNESRLKFICKFYHIDDQSCEQFQQEWDGFLTCVILSCSGLQNSEDSTRFWPLAMNTCKKSLTPLTDQMLGRIMVTAFSSSEVERGFSVMNSLKTKARSRLDKDTLDSLMTVKINGPDVDKFNVYEYTIEFLKEFSRVDDSTWKGGRKLAPEKFPSMFKKSRIY